ncbi:RHS repeat-associated core domain-containing protein [Chitinophaga jiangningensis]|uniref:RHS repeat-associated core domain-containing protein n=1 Tax=Chitinophaga jiangningensis TaxID=1419482 RepID=A0A1M7DN95_9BACT|nr:DUF6443 domain-containing protein [Chitinophaga jiangningensis]SHL80952.1 RHS repeat-associated core domain-containing protein [Chitinophaga jiangningensis]
MRLSLSNYIFFILSISGIGLLSQRASAQYTDLNPGTISIEKSMLVANTSDVVNIINTQTATYKRGLLITASAQILMEVSTDNVNWVPDYSFNGYQRVVPPVGTYFYRRRAIAPTLPFAYSNTVQLKVSAPYTGGAIAASQEVAPGAIPQALSSISNPQGGNNTFTYIWESSVDEMTWTVIQGATASGYQPPALSKTTYFRRKATSDNISVYANTVKVAVVRNEVNMPALTALTGTEAVVAISPFTDMVPGNIKGMSEVLFLKPGVNTWNPDQTSLVPNQDFMRTNTYVDGILRPLQQVSVKVSKSGKDLVTPYEHDQYGRRLIQFLPYLTTADGTTAGTLKTDVATQQPAFYANLTGNNDNYFYSKIVTEASSAPRFMKSMSPGIGQVGSNVGGRSASRLNKVEDEVRIWAIGDNQDDLPFSTGLYNPGELVVSVITDAHDNKNYTYTDRTGNVIMTATQVQGADMPANNARTYFVYDDMQELRAIVTPKAVDYCTTTGSWDFTGNGIKVFDELCYRYCKDDKGNVIYSRTPGATLPTEWVYDFRNRPVFYQTPALKEEGKGEWVYLQYDNIDRPVMRGIYTDPAATRTSLQTLVNANTTTRIVNQSITLPPQAELNINKRDPSIPGYSAGLNINLFPGFETEENATIEFVVDPNLPGQVQQYTVSYISGFTPAVYDPQVFYYYDNYSWNGAHLFNTDFQLNPGAALYPVPVAPTPNTKGQITGYKVKLNDKAQWLTTTLFYDEYDRCIQQQSDNITGGTDILTGQYDFGGNILSAYSVRRNNKSLDFPELKTQIRYEYTSNALTGVYHTIYNGTTATTKKVTGYDYNDLYQLTQTQLGDLETLDYEYDLLGRLTGINSAYAKNKSGNHYFGMEISYDKGFTNARKDGKISGVTWRRKGNEDEWHAYGYDYYSGGNLKKADYTQYSGGNWNNAVTDFQLSDLAYDKNGNMLQLKQHSMLPGSYKTVLDNLQYSYGFDGSAWSNKIQSIADAAGNQQQGDFSDGAHNSTEYQYDADGNMTRDLNRGITIKYNRFNAKPELITFDADPAKSIQYVYDANGNKLQKIVKSGNTSATYTYLSDLVFKDDVLMLFSHPSGRVRKNAQGELKYDYFISDQADNTRTVLTEETTEMAYRASHEDNPSPAPPAPEREMFSFPQQVDVIPAGNPFYDYNGTNRKFVKLNHVDASRRVGTSKVLRVMAGDKVELGVYAYYAENNSSNNTPDNLPSEIVNQLVNAMLGPVTALAGHSSVVTGINNGITLNKEDFETFVQNSNSSNPPSTVPKAYLNYVLFDENFKLVDGSSKRVTSPGVINELTGSMDISKNGYLYIYVNNESDVDVCFDDLIIKHTSGHLLQEDTYFPFGMGIRALSSMAGNRLTNNYLYNGMENTADFDLDVYDVAYRNYDPQTGRWWQRDPELNSLVSYSPYAANFNDPVNFGDPEGNYPFNLTGPEFWASAAGMAAGTAVGYLYAANNGKDKGAYALGGAAIGAGLGFLSSRISINVNMNVLEGAGSTACAITNNTIFNEMLRITGLLLSRPKQLDASYHGKSNWTDHYVSIMPKGPGPKPKPNPRKKRYIHEVKTKPTPDLEIDYPGSDLESEFPGANIPTIDIDYSKIHPGNGGDGARPHPVPPPPKPPVPTPPIAILFYGRGRYTDINIYHDVLIKIRQAAVTALITPTRSLVLLFENRSPTYIIPRNREPNVVFDDNDKMVVTTKGTAIERYAVKLLRERIKNLNKVISRMFGVQASIRYIDKTPYIWIDSK